LGIIIAVILVILGIAMVSGAFGSLNQTKTTWTFNLSATGAETFNYIQLPNGTTSVQVEYSNLTNTTSFTSYFQFITLSFVPEQSQIIDYNNNIDLRTVSANSTHPTGNLTLLANGAKSVGIVDVSAEGTIKITAVS
jgi:hypothetical protein